MWKPRSLPNDFAQTVKSIYDSMAEFAKPGFDEEDLRCLHSVISLIMEFNLYLETANLAAFDKDNANYMCESIFSGIESFITLNNSYKILAGSISSELAGDFVPVHLLKEHFTRIYKEFLSERIFENKCRLMLDMFKLEIVFAGLVFD